MVGLIQRSQLSKVNARRLLEDLAGDYSYSLEEAVLVELIANALDAKATRISFLLDSRRRTLTIQDDGRGMTQEEFEKYHDLAESRKQRGQGIGFAGLGAKLSHKLTVKIVTETRSEAYHGATEWRFRGDDLEWHSVRSTSFKGHGTKVSLFLNRSGEGILAPGFIESTVRKHYGALSDPFLSELYVWDAVYPQGVSFDINNSPLTKQPLVAPGDAEKLLQRDFFDRRKRRIGRAVFGLMMKPLPEEQQGVAISTYGKVIRWDHLGRYSRSPDRITGWVEAPSLVECLTLNKQGFVDHGPVGAKYRQIRRTLQTVFEAWLAEISQSQEPEDQRRAPKALARETAQIIRRIPELRYLFASRTREQVPAPDQNGEDMAVLQETLQTTAGVLPGQPETNGPHAAPGPEEGEALAVSPVGDTRVRTRPQRVRSGPSISLVADPQRKEMSWVSRDTVFINTAHATYAKAQREHQVAYHQRIAVFLALCQEASVEPDQKLELLARALYEWGRS